MASIYTHHTAAVRLLGVLTLWAVQKALAEEKEAKGQSLQRRTELDTQLEQTIKSLDSVTAEKEMTKATLTDTQKDLQKEKNAGVALGEQVITLSKQLEDQTARAVKAEYTSKQLQEGVARAIPRHCSSLTVCHRICECGCYSTPAVHTMMHLAWHGHQTAVLIVLPYW